MTMLLSTVRNWTCPACKAEDTTTEARPHSRYHTCPKLGYLSVPMVPAGTSAKIELHEREDYVGKEVVRLVDGRPVMSITTTRDDGQDAVVFAPTASGTGDAHG